MRRVPGPDEVGVLVLHHPRVDPALPHGPGAVLGGAERREGVIGRDDEAAEVLLLVLRVERRERVQVHEALVGHVLGRVEEDFVPSARRSDFHVADPGPARRGDRAEELLHATAPSQGAEGEGLCQIAHARRVEPGTDSALPPGIRGGGPATGSPAYGA